jgi:DNA polymerase III subunit gamma/tau
MGYEPLHHKYRPQVFADLVGQEAIATTLVNALKSQRIAPAYLFTGARGTGKTSSARIMAKSLNCLASAVPTADPCGVCELCRAVTVGSALDITEIDAASNTGVDNIRELIERAQFAPVQARYKVYIIDEVHMLSTAAFNALLKTLEEPPNRVVFILATTDPQRVLPTIISRCQRFDFRRIPLEAMVNHLTKIAKIEQIAIAPAATTLVSQISQGGLRDAESLLDQLSLLEGEISPEAVWDLVGVVPERDLLAILTAIADSNSTQLLEQLRRIMDRGREPLIVLQNLASCYRDLLIAQSSDRRDLVALTDQGWQQLQQLAKNLSLETILQGQQHLRQAEVQIKNTTQPRLWLEITLLGLLPAAIAPKIVTIQTAAKLETNPVLASQPIQSETQIRTAIAPITPVEPQLKNQASEKEPHQPIETAKAIPSNPMLSVADLAHNQDRDLDSQWQELIQLLPTVSRGVLKGNGKFVSIEGDLVKIGLNSAKLKEIAETKKTEILKHCEQVFGRKVQISFVTSNSITNIPADESQAKNSTRNQPKTIDHKISTTIATPTYSQPSSQIEPASSQANPQVNQAFSQSINQSTSQRSPETKTESKIVPKSNLQSDISSSVASNPNISKPDLSKPAKTFKPTFYQDSAQEFAVKNVANFFNGQIIDLDQLEASSDDSADSTDHSAGLSAESDGTEPK